MKKYTLSKYVLKDSRSFEKEMQIKIQLQIKEITKGFPQPSIERFLKTRIQSFNPNTNAKE